MHCISILMKIKDLKMSLSTFPFMALGLIDPLQAPVGSSYPVAIEIIAFNSETWDESVKLSQLDSKSCSGAI